MAVGFSSQLAVVVGLIAVSGAGWTSGVPPLLLALVLLGAVALLLLAPRTIYFLGKDEQLKVELFTETKVHNGPGITLLNPLSYRTAVKRKAQALGVMDYVKIKDEVSGTEVVERGPQLFFLGPHQVVLDRGVGLTLSKTEYIIVEDKLSGDSSTVKGPCVWYPQPHDTPSGKQTAISLQEDEYVKLRDSATGQRWVQRGKDLVFLEPTWKAEHGVRKAWTLKSYEYVRLLDSVSGKVTVHRGENTVFPGPNEDLLDNDKLAATELKVNEYIKILDQTDGSIRVVAGASIVFLGANEKVLENGKKKAVEVDDEHAVLVRNASTGQLRLVTENQLFIPGPNEQIEEVRELIRLADHEAMITKDKDGNLLFHYGDPTKQSEDQPRSFFLPPHTEIVKLWWSGGLRRAKRDLCIERFDSRPQFMWNEIDCRTSDNVELVLETTIFWEVIDLAKLVRTTGNLPGDIYNQIRSQFIKHVARVTLKGFMESLHAISKSIFEEDSSFYEKRGVKIHSLDVTKYMCSEKRTSEVLNQIIEETTNRLNRLSQAESENEVRLYKMQGQLEEEKLNSKLLEIQHEHTKTEASVSGLAEAERVSSFLQGLEANAPQLQDRIAMWQVLRKTDALGVVSAGGANLYYTPNDVNLSIKCEGGAKSA